MIRVTTPGTIGTTEQQQKLIGIFKHIQKSICDLSSPNRSFFWSKVEHEISWSYYYFYGANNISL